LGSSFAGVKAGIIGGSFFAGSIGIFNYVLLVALKSSVLTVLTQTGVCSGSSQTNSTLTVGDCYVALTSVLLPLVVFLIFIVVLVFAFLFGLFFENLPGKGYRTKASIISCLVILTMLFFRLEGVYTDTTQGVIMIVFDVAAAAGLTHILGTFYKRYTRTVEFSTPESDPVEITIGRRLVNGKTLTFPTRSSHRIVARTPENRVFKEWIISGGVSVEDAGSHETVMHIEGDGLLKAQSTPAT
jgi:hypothetical protein